MNDKDRVTIGDVINGDMTEQQAEAVEMSRKLGQRAAEDIDRMVFEAMGLGLEVDDFTPDLYSLHDPDDYDTPVCRRQEWTRQVKARFRVWMIHTCGCVRFGFMLTNLSVEEGSDKQRRTITLTFRKRCPPLVFMDSKTKARLRNADPYRKMRWRDVVRLAWLLLWSKPKEA